MNEPLEYRVGRDRMTPHGRRLAIRLVIGGLILAAIVMCVTKMNRDAEREWRHGNGGRCASHLQQIGQAIYLYADENQGAMPPNLAVLSDTVDLPAEVFVCPSADETTSAATRPDALVADLAPGGGHLSYIYVAGLGRYATLTASDVVAFESPGRHPKSFDGANLLFGDGHVEFVEAKAAADVQRQFDAGTRPIRIGGGQQ